MAEDFGNGASRTLSALMRQFSAVVWQKGKPPLDSELNLMSQVEAERLRQTVKSVMHSGWLIDPTRTKIDFSCSKDWSNYFVFGKQKSGEKEPLLFANVNGWVIPVAGTFTETEEEKTNRIRLNPPPATDSRVDLVFLEAWQTLVAPNPSEANKPAVDKVWKYGNVEYGGSNIEDDLEDPTIGFETSERCQIQYRIRVYGSGAGLGAGVALDKYPDGLGDLNILGQGTQDAPVAGSSFANVREKLDDPSLWRAGDGDPNNALGTIDGYVYAIPLCAIFRRNTNTFVAVTSAGNPNQNGALDRNPSTGQLADPREGAKALAVPTLLDNLLADSLGTVQVTGLIGSGFDDTLHLPEGLFLQVEDEIIGISEVDVTTTPPTITLEDRGRYGTHATTHLAGSPIQFFSVRPDGLFADEVHPTDILDLRRAVTPGEWDYHRLLEHNIAALAKNDLHSTHKRSAAGDTEGPVVAEVSYMLADGSTDVPNHTEGLDGPDGTRIIFSDACSVQQQVTLLLDNDATLTQGAVNDEFDSNVGWDVAPDFKPSGWVNNEGSTGSWTNGSVIFLHIGGEDGSGGARASFRSGSDKKVRFVTPKEHWKTGYPTVNPLNGNQYPVTVQFLGAPAHQPMALYEQDVDAHALKKHPGPMYPYRRLNFESPFIVLGGLLDSSLRMTGLAVATKYTAIAQAEGFCEIQVDVNFDTEGVYHTTEHGQFENDPSTVSAPLLRGSRTLYGMLTDEGRDRTGKSSEVYVVLYGDNASGGRVNNGCFRVIGAGTAGYTEHSADDAYSIVVAPLDPEFTTFDTTTGGVVTAEFRSQYTNAEDGNGLTTGDPALCIVLTDLGGLADHPWNKALLDDTVGDFDYSFPIDAASGLVKIDAKLVLSTTLLYHPGRGAMARLPDSLTRFSLTNADSTYLRQSPGALDTTFSAASGTPGSETFFDPVHVQLWNRLPSLGWDAPVAPGYGGRIVANTEQDRDNELFIDRGSKTVVFRPYRYRQMTLNGITVGLNTTVDPCGGAVVEVGLDGNYLYPDTTPKDAHELFTGSLATGKRMGFPIPTEAMPRFGRQDIPYFQDITGNGSGTFLAGINHMFCDSTTLNNEVFKIIGGEDNESSGSQVKPIFFRTGTPQDYGHGGTVIGIVDNKPYYEARKVSDIDESTEKGTVVRTKFRTVVSSDFGPGLDGIQLPPYLGVARLYGVYDYDDYQSKGGRSFESDRVTLENDPATNLLRTDATEQTLFIMRDGALDLTGETGDHTYVIPSNVIDVTLSPKHKLNDSTSQKETFRDFEYVVEMTVFGFSKEWINGNNYVLARRHDAQGNLVSDGDNEELEDLSMVFPCAASLNSAVYSLYNRTVYQGDPYMTRAGAVRTVSDYEHRYGQVSVANAYELVHPIQQFNDQGEAQVQLPNPRMFEVLASMDFYTTLGTGKIGGHLYPGTLLDVGYTEDTLSSSRRIPGSSDDSAWRVLTRAFTEGQKTNSNRAEAEIRFLPGSVSAMDGATITITDLDGLSFDFTARAALTDEVVLGEDEFRIVTGYRPLVWTQQLDFPALLPGESTSFTIGADGSGENYETHILNNAGLQFGNTVDINAMTGADYPENLIVQALVTNDNVLKVTATNSAAMAVRHPSVKAQHAWDGTDGVASTGSAPVTILEHTAHTSTAITVAGAGLNDVVLVNIHGIDSDNDDEWDGPVSGIIADGYVSQAGEVKIRLTNTTDADIALEDSAVTYEIRVFFADVEATTTDPVAQNFVLRALDTHRDVELTANRFAIAVNRRTGMGNAIQAMAAHADMVRLIGVPTGAEGNGLKVTTTRDNSGANVDAAKTVARLFQIVVPHSNNLPIDSFLGAVFTSAYFRGGADIPMNAGDGTSQMGLTGMTDRFPLGILLQDSDFVCENPLNDQATAMKTSPSGLRPIQTMLPLSERGEEHDRFMGEPGEMVSMSDGSILVYTPFHDANRPTGTHNYRVYRGGGAVMAMSGKNPGGPVDWVSESLIAPLKPVLKAGALCCKAMLVRNFVEAAFADPMEVSAGDEIQMIMITHGVLGSGNTQNNGVMIAGTISPTGYGEGYAAADRYRIDGKPMMGSAHSRAHRPFDAVEPVPLITDNDPIE